MEDIAIENQPSNESINNQETKDTGNSENVSSEEVEVGKKEDEEEEEEPEDRSRFTEDEFREWILEEMTNMAPQVREMYPETILECADAVTRWRRRFRGNPALWRRLFKHERVLKEVIESVPVVKAVQDWIERHSSEQESATSGKVTIIDLCSGKGYLSMLLSEILPPDRVEKCLLIDKAWPMCHSTPHAHHMSWEHIYGDMNIDVGPRYFNTWPIPLVTCKKNLKQSKELDYLRQRFSPSSSKDGETQDVPIVLILAVHLCGTLSIQAVKLFQMIPSAQMLLLKPCCLPDIWHAKNAPYFYVGDYCFPTNDVCARGKWTADKKKNKWEGPPRWHLQSKFDKWCHYLHEAMAYQSQHSTDATDDQQSSGQPLISTKYFEVPVQTKGGFQNVFLYAERGQ